jgi:hypothetical protein
MRDQAALNGAFALLERVADGYAAAVEESVAAESDTAIHELIPVPTARGPRPRPALVLAAGLVVVALALGIGYLARSSTSAQPAVGPTGESGRGADGVPARSLPFAVGPGSGMQITAVAALDGADTAVYLAGRGDHWQLNLYGPGSIFAPRFSVGVQAVVVDGKPGYDGASSLITVRKASITSTPSPSASEGTAPAPVRATDHSVAWRYEPAGWALLQPAGSVSAPISALAVARSLDFNTSTVMRSAFSLRHAPSGMHLQTWASAYQTAAGISLGVGGRGTDVTYEPRGSGNWVDIKVSSSATRSAAGLDITVDGQPGRWYASSHAITVQLGAHLFISVGAVAATFHGPLTMTKAQLIAVGSSITVTSSLSHPNRWLDGKAALP